MVHSASEFCCLYQAGECEYSLARSRSLSNMETTYFPQFSSLPPEIRNAIWREAALGAYKDRLLILGGHQGRVFNGELPRSIYVSSQMQQSPIFLVNRESRREARNIYNVRLHVYDTGVEDDTSHSCGVLNHCCGVSFRVVYKGEVYISLVHDIFVQQDDSFLYTLYRDVIPFTYQSLRSHPITGLLSRDHTTSIKRLMIIHWLDLGRGFLADPSDGESEPDVDVDTLIDQSKVENRHYHKRVKFTFNGASSSIHLYVDLTHFDRATMKEILTSSAGQLIHKFTK